MQLACSRWKRRQQQSNPNGREADLNINMRRMQSNYPVPRTGIQRAYEHREPNREFDCSGRSEGQANVPASTNTDWLTQPLLWPPVLPFTCCLTGSLVDWENRKEDTRKETTVISMDMCLLTFLQNDLIFVAAAHVPPILFLCRFLGQATFSSKQAPRLLQQASWWAVDVQGTHTCRYEMKASYNQLN